MFVFHSLKQPRLEKENRTPIYQFRNLKTGGIEERFLPVHRRDCAEPHLKRITVPQRVGFANASHLREPGAQADVPKAFREYELSGADVHKIERETGFKRESIRRIWNFLFVALAMLTLSANAADITAGYSFTPTDRVTSTKLNSLVGDADINTTFATDKSSAQPLAADTVLFYQASSGNWRKTTFDQLLLSNTNLIVGQVESDAPTTNDFFLFYDTSAGTLAKVPLDGLLTNLFLIAQRQEFTNGPLPELSHLLIESNNVLYRVSWSNFFQYWWRDERFSTNVGYTDPLTNPFVLSVHTAPTNRDALVIWDAQHQTNKVTTLEGLITNLPAARPGGTNSDTFAFIQTRTNAVNPFGTNGVLSKMTFADLFTNWFQLADGTVTNTDTFLVWSTATNANGLATNFPAKVKLSSLYQKFYTNGIPLSGTGFQANGQHGLGGTPQIVKWYLMQTNSGGDASYLQGDIVPVEAFENSANAVVFAGGANSTNVFLTMRTTTPQVCTKAGASLTVITLSKWTAVCEAIYYP